MTNKEKMMADFKDVKLIFQKVGVRFFSIKGTCLGSIRNADFIEWDTNIDQAVFASQDEIDAIRKLLFDEGFEILIQFDCLVATRNTTVNIYRVLKDDKGFYVDDTPPIYFKKENLDTLVTSVLGGEFCYTQTNPTEHLVDLYGENWATPKPK
jgi:hypothetical protein